MTTTLELRVQPEVAYDAARLRSVAAESLDIAPREITHVRIVRRSIDARQRNVMVNLGVQIWVGEQPTELAYTPIRYGDVARAPQAVVVGAGPAGLFAALRLIELGVRPVVLERGCDVDGRKKDIAAIARTGTVDPESNYSFGEGGAGAFSDGKLYTRSKKRGNVARILGIFCQHGAATDILADAHPHIGTDRLPGIIAAMRRQIIESGGEVHFRTRVDALLFSADGQRVEGVRTAATSGKAPWCSPPDTLPATFIAICTPREWRSNRKAWPWACVWSIRPISSTRFNITTARDVAAISPRPNMPSCSR